MPHGKIDTLGYFAGLAVANIGPNLMDPGPRHADFTHDTAPNQIDSLFHGRRTASLNSALNDSIVFTRCLDNPSAFYEIMADWFFAIHVFTSLTAHHGHQSMPVIRSGHHNGIDRLIVQYFAKIRLDFGDWPFGLFQMILSLGKDSGIHVAQDRNFKSVVFGKYTDQVSAPASGTNHADADFFVRRCRQSF